MAVCFMRVKQNYILPFGTPSVFPSDLTPPTLCLRGISIMLACVSLCLQAVYVVQRPTSGAAAKPTAVVPPWPGCYSHQVLPIPTTETRYCNYSLRGITGPAQQQILYSLRRFHAVRSLTKQVNKVKSHLLKGSSTSILARLC